MNIRSISMLTYLTITLMIAVVLGGCTSVTSPAGSTQSQLQSGVEEDKGPSGGMTERQAEIAERGAQVMPFDLEQTTHVFEKLGNGGVQRIITNEGADADQVRLIQMHLRQEAEKFQAGDFDDPAQIHGVEMPGLAVLRKHANAVEVRFTALDNGAQLDYISDDPEMIAAIHAWFDAQLSDHGIHATNTMPSAPSMHPARDASATANLPIVGAIWTANEQGDSLTVVDAATSAVVATLSGIAGPHNIQISPDGQTAWAVSGHEGLAVAISAQDFTLLGTAPVGNAPAHIIISQDGATAYVSNSDDNTVTVLDTATFSTRATIPVGAFPHGLRASPDGQWVAVANLRGDTVSLIDTATLSLIATIAVGAGPVQVAFAPDGATLYVTLNGENAVAAVDLATQTVIGKATVGKGPVQVYVTPDSSLILVANQGSAEAPGTTLSFVDAVTLTEVDAIETGQGAHGVVVEPSGRYAYVTNLFSNTLTIVDLANRTIAATTPTGASPNGVSFSPLSPGTGPAIEVVLPLPTHAPVGTDGDVEGHDAHH